MDMEEEDEAHTVITRSDALDVIGLHLSVDFEGVARCLTDRYAASHLELVLPSYTSHATCKNGSHHKYRGCNALTGSHPFNYCLLNLHFGTPFEAPILSL